MASLWQPQVALTLGCLLLSCPCLLRPCTWSFDAGLAAVLPARHAPCRARSHLLGAAWRCCRWPAACHLLQVLAALHAGGCRRLPGHVLVWWSVLQMTHSHAACCLCSTAACCPRQKLTCRLCCARPGPAGCPLWRAHFSRDASRCPAVSAPRSLQCCSLLLLLLPLLLLLLKAHPQAMARTSQPRRMSILVGTSLEGPATTPSCPWSFRPQV